MKTNKTLSFSRMFFSALGAGLIIFFAAIPPAHSEMIQLSNTDFTGFVTGVSVDGQGGWKIGIGVPTKWPDEEVTDDGTGNTVFRFSNAVSSGDLNDMPFAPRPAGIPNFPFDPANNPVLDRPELFAGESSTGAAHRYFAVSFDIRSVTGAPQANLYATISPDNGAGGRMGFLAFSDSGTGIDLITWDVDAAGNWIGPTTIAAGLSYTGWHHIALEIRFEDGPSNDVVKIYLDGTLIHTGTTWEDYYPAVFPADYPLGVPVQTIVFTAGATDRPLNNGKGFYFDNVLIQVELLGVPTLSQWGQILLAAGLMGVAFVYLRKRRIRDQHLPT